MSKFYTNINKWGNNILIRQIIDGDQVDHKIPFEPTLYIPSTKPTGFKGFYGEDLSPKLFDSMTNARDFIKQYKAVPEFDIHGNDNYPIQYLAQEFPDEVDYSLSELRIGNFDIENDKSPDGSFAKVDNPLGAITAITLYDNLDEKYYLFTTLDWQLKDTKLDFITEDTIEYNLCKDEKDLLIRFINHVHSKGYHALTGWNISGYDIPYLVNRSNMVVGEKATKRLSPWGIINKKNKKDEFGNTVFEYQLIGTATLDYLTLYKKFTFVNQESYTLDHIGYVEVKERKLDIAGAELHALSRTDPQRFIDYNIKDVNLVKRIDDKMKLIDLIYTLSYYAKVDVVDILSPVRTWDAIIYHTLLKDNIVVPPMKKHSKSGSFAGAVVKDPKVGFSDWIISVDLASLYPHLIMQYNLGTDTILPNRVNEIQVEEHNGKRFVDSRLTSKELNLSKYTDIIAANGTMYDKSKRGILPKLMDDLYKKRKYYKKLMLVEEQKLADGDNSKEVINNISKYNNLQMAMKILLNSAYGACGTPYFRYFNIDIAEAITLSGQLSIQWIIRKLNEFMNKLLETTDKDYVIASDTDSSYIEFGDLVKKIFPKDAPKEKIINALDSFAKAKLEPFLEESYEELAEYMNAYENKMEMEREAIAEKGFWTAKKRYALSVWDNEGVRYQTPKLKVLGLESKKSSTPQICRDKLYAAYGLMLKDTSDNDTLIKYIDEFKTKWNELNLDEISFPRGCNGVTKYYDELNVFGKKCPIHVKGALYHNKLINDLGLEKEIETIKNGDKIKFLPLIEPNPIRSPVISFKGKLPPEFGLEKYIDYDLQFSKSFLEPMKSALDAVGWKSEEVNTLEDLFG